MITVHGLILGASQLRSRLADVFILENCKSPRRLGVACQAVEEKLSLLKEVCKGLGDVLNHLPRVKIGQARGVCCSGEKDGESFAPGVQSPVPPTKRSTLQSVNWFTKHRCVSLVFFLAFTLSIYSLPVCLQCFPLLPILSSYALLSILYFLRDVCSSSQFA